MVHAYEQTGYRDGQLTGWMVGSGVVSTLFTTALLAMAICTTMFAVRTCRTDWGD
jgi:hypothetical protein